LQATALVHEAWLRMIGAGDRGWQNRAHFLARRPRPCGVFWLIMRAINPD
jgi:hypothetical protein